MSGVTIKSVVRQGEARKVFIAPPYRLLVMAFSILEPLMLWVTGFHIWGLSKKIHTLGGGSTFPLGISLICLISPAPVSSDLFLSASPARVISPKRFRRCSSIWRTIPGKCMPFRIPSWKSDSRTL